MRDPIGERFIVISDQGVRHPKGTLVEVRLISKYAEDPEPYYCRAVGGETCYWYGPDEIAKEVDGLKA